MEPYNVLSETEYYPRDKFSPDLNPNYGSRKKSVNEELAAVFYFAPTSRIALHWFGSARFVLERPLVGEEELFAAARVELERMRKEVRA